MHVNGAPQLSSNSSDGGWFDGVASDLRAESHGVRLVTEALPVLLPKGGMLFIEGQSARGVFLLRAGRAKEFMVSRSGRIVIVRVVGPGAILGLQAVLSGAPHESTIETLEPCRADFLGKTVFLQLLKSSGRLAQIVASQLSRDCQDMYASMRCFTLCGSASGRLARLVLHWAECPLVNQDDESAKIRIRVILTHSEIGQMMGTTRETMSRTLRAFRQKRWITTNGSIWTIANVGAVQNVAAL
jgi:CRP/FNR family transcriptional regulator, cyclic AMP receptor protein